jgi:hypothetical protein
MCILAESPTFFMHKKVEGGSDERLSRNPPIERFGFRV